MSDDPAITPVESSRLLHRSLLCFAFVGSIGLHIALQWGVLLARSDFSWTGFRTYFASDQLSYMSMVTNAFHGRFADVEPFTETGSNSYPHLYYETIGMIARITGVGPLVAWSVGGLVVQVALVFAIGLALYALSSRWWSPLLAPLPFLVGTFSAFLTGGWYISMNSHAVLWGPFGVFYTLNGETAGLSLGVIGILIALVAFVRVESGRKRLWLFCISAVCIGLTANIQTYSFIVCVYLVLIVVAVYTLIWSNQPGLTLLSLVLVILTVLAGPFLASRVGPLAVLALGLVATLPALTVLVIRFRSSAILPLASLLIAASPQVAITITGLVSGDPFLSYRVDSSKDLGVDWRGIVGSAAVWIPLLVILAAGVHRRMVLYMAVPIGALSAWILTSTNDRWGANQEPYRFWLDMFVVVSITTLPLFLKVALEYLGRPSRVFPHLAPYPVAPAGESKTSRSVALGLVIVATVVVGVSFVDYSKFVETYDQSLYHYDTPRDEALALIAGLVDSEAGGILVPDPCIDPFSLKITSGAPIAFYNVGMAWPERRDAIDIVVRDRFAGVLDADHAASADVRWVITDSKCSNDWAARYADQLTSVAAVDYPVGDAPGTVTLWRVGA